MNWRDCLRVADHTEVDWNPAQSQPALEVPVLRFRVYARVWRTIPFAMFLLGAVGLSHAQSEKTPIESCGKLHTQSEMNDCAATEAKKADTVLNATYRQLLSKVKENKTATEKVVAAEKAWIVFRDAELAAEWPVPDGDNPNALYGSVHPLCYYNEFAAMTWERVKALKKLVRNEEGDVCSSGLAQSGESDASRTCNSEKPKVRGLRDRVS
jgi:uncharacterized protein YecT (DUF1311 family)